MNDRCNHLNYLLVDIKRENARKKIDSSKYHCNIKHLTRRCTEVVDHLTLNTFLSNIFSDIFPT